MNDQIRNAIYVTAVIRHSICRNDIGKNEMESGTMFWLVIYSPILITHFLHYSKARILFLV